jgi:hypothetical protein
MDSSNEYRLFQYALKQLHEAGLDRKDWAIGGGTVLKQHFEHRFSKDIDIFFDNPQMVSALSPRFNDANKDKMIRYFEDAMCTKLVFPEGKVDFVVAGQVTDFKPSLREFHGEKVFMEDPVEIVAKKIWHRDSDFKDRDFFDLATLYLSDRKEDLIKTTIEMPDKIDEIRKKIEHSDYDVRNIEPLPNGKNIIGRELDIAMDFINEVKSRVQGLSEISDKYPYIHVSPLYRNTERAKR